MKKEDLQIEMGKLERRNQDLTNDDQRRREEFAKVFNWYEEKPSDMFSYASKGEKIQRTPSWEEVFTKVGRLLQVDNTAEMTKAFNDLQNDKSFLEQELNKLNNKQ